MGTNSYGAMKGRAKQLGMTPAEYATRVLLGEKRCGGCGAWKPREAFGQDATRFDGRACVCVSCRESRTRPGPPRRERRARAARGERWCRLCADWHAGARRGGPCRGHLNEIERERYRTDPVFRDYRKSRRDLRKRGVTAVPHHAVESLLDEFHGECAYCSRAPTTWDHIVPVARGGQTMPWNIVPACASCNSRKKDKDPFDWLDGVEDQQKLVRVLGRMDLENQPTLYRALMTG